MLPMRRPLYGNYSALRKHSRNLMRHSTTLQKFILICGTFLIVSTLFIAYQLTSCGPCPDCPSIPQVAVHPTAHINIPPPGNIPVLLKGRNENIVKNAVGKESDEASWGRHKLALIVPFRNRFDELLEFVPHMHIFLNAQRVRHQIFVINQADNYRFNRASLINIGFLESSFDCDYICMHDVDLLPLNPDLNYSYPDDGPFHVAAPDLHPRYHYKTFVGGILLLKKAHFQQVNGMSNKYWGWGLEDDEFYVRLKQADLKVSRPVGIKTNHLNTFKHIHDRVKRPRDGRRYGNQKKSSRKRDYVTGLNTVQYKLVSFQLLHIDHCPVTVINVELECDLNETPWCKEPEVPRRLLPSGQIVAPLGNKKL